MGETGTEESGWTKANLQKLLAAMKTSIPENDRKRSYTRGLETMNWNKVAFPPFSPEACKEKWGQILQKMSKTRTLTELLVEAEGAISNPICNSKIHPERPKRPAPPNAIFLEENRAKYLEMHPKMSRQKVFKNLIKKYQMLPDEEKAQYVEKFKLANEEYARKMLVFRKQYSTNPVCKTYRKKLSANTKPVRDEPEETKGMPPQPPLSGYRLYCKEQCTSGEGLKGNGCVSMWAQGWRDMTETERNTYNTRREELKRQYNVKLNEYLMNFDEKKQRQILKVTGIKRPIRSTGINKRKKIPGEPKMPSQSGSGIFSKKQMLLLREKIPKSRDRFAVVNKMWQDLPAVEKNCYKKEAFEDIRKYSMKLQKWFETLPAAQQQLFRTQNPSKIQYLDVSQIEVYDIEEPRGAGYLPSDSEDEDTTDSSEEEETNVEFDEVEEEEDNDAIVFNVY